MFNNYCGYDIFLNAYKYTSVYLLVSLTVTVFSVICVWLYENPLLCKFIFKKSIHSNVISSNESVENYQCSNKDVFETLEQKNKESMEN
ncbi:unnamed protein product [Parnassius mnemosyne]